MEAQLTENRTVLSENFASSFFHGFPTDGRFLNCSYQKFMPSSNLDARTQTFSLSRYDAPNLYMVRSCKLNNSLIRKKALLTPLTKFFIKSYY